MTATREINREELLDVAVDIGALAHYVVMLTGGTYESPLYERILAARARLMIELGHCLRDGDGQLVALDEMEQDDFLEEESSRGGKWLRADLSRQLARYGGGLADEKGGA